jgi:hypothetical protein
VDRDHVGAGAGELADLVLGSLDHQVDVEQRAVFARQLAQRADGQWAHRDRRYEMAVHHVDVDDPRARLEHLSDLRTELGEVGGEDRRRDARLEEQRRGHISTSMFPPQLPQRTIAVVSIRTIVECSPQSGQTETSSKRCRQ